MNLVLDASVALGWCIRRVDSDEAALVESALQAVAEHGAEVPALWYLEVANTLLVLERARRVGREEADRYLEDLRELAIREDARSAGGGQAEVIALGRAYGLPAYDASYLEIALRRDAAVATLDRKLAVACRAAGVRVFGDGA